MNVGGLTLGFASGPGRCIRISAGGDLAGHTEFAGVWQFGGCGEHFRDVEVFGAIGDGESSAL